MIINNVKFVGSRIMPNPVEVDYWIDTRSDPYGSVIKYFNGIEWVALTLGGSVGVDLTNFYTKAEINNMFLNFDAFDESKYYTKTEIDRKGYLTSIPSKYVTDDELAAKGYLTQHQDLSHLALKVDVYDKATVDQKIANIATGGSVDLSNYYTKQQVYNKTEIDNKFANIDTPNVDLSNYYTKQQVDDKIPDTSNFITADDIPTNVSELNNDAGYITLDEVPVTDLTEYVKIDQVYSKEQVDDLIDNIDTPEVSNVEEIIISNGEQPEDAEIWIDLSEQSPTNSYIDDAPIDGKMYVRMNGMWIELPAFVQEPEEPEQEELFMYYGYINDSISNMNQITFDMLQVASMKKTTPQTLNKTSIGVAPQGSKVVVCIPENSNLVAYKDNGMGSKTKFDVSILGCNGIVVTYNNNTYKLYGEFMTVNGEIFIYVDNI